MKAIRVHQYGGPEVLGYEDSTIPEPGQGEARVKIETSGINFVDIYQRQGLYPVALPFTPGQEAAGVVDAVGPGVTGVRTGDRVAYTAAPGSYAEYAVVPAWRLVPVPDGIGTQQAAAVMLQGMTAHYLACSTYPLKAGDTALVHAAAGGVGLILVQIAKRRGAHVIGTVSTEEKARLARQAGADEVILYTRTDWEAEVKHLTGGKGVNVVYDGVGVMTFEKSLNCLRPRGFMVLFGQSSGPVPPVDLQIFNTKGGLFLTRPSLMQYTADRAELMERANDLFNWMLHGGLTVRIDSVFPLAKAADAHRKLASRATMGKVLLAVR
ncbi:MAG: quinone oxidoreductase [Deltaproteobacteria bacterium]|nr:quinone oxidoreductase [Deltaproteobacteria bacterium]